MGEGDTPWVCALLIGRGARTHLAASFVTTGDVMIVLDADLLDWDTHFVPARQCTTRG